MKLNPIISWFYIVGFIESIIKNFKKLPFCNQKLRYFFFIIKFALINHQALSLIQLIQKIDLLMSLNKTNQNDPDIKNIHKSYFVINKNYA